MSNFEYSSSQRGVPHPDETPIDPYDQQALRDLDSTQHTRTLRMIAKKIRTTEAQLERELRHLGLSTRGSLLDVSIDKSRRLVRDPASVPAARRAETAQSNLRSHYQQWARVCERYIRAVEELDTPAGEENSE